MDNPDTQIESREKAFVEHVIARAKEDAGYAAKLKRGDNPGTEYYAYEALASFIDLNDDRKRLPYALVGAAICREKLENDGNTGIGSTLAKCFMDNKDQGNLRLRRLLSCDSIESVCSLLRHNLKLIQSRMPGLLSYARLLSDLDKFGASDWWRDKTKRAWAMDFYAVSLSENGQEDE